jgi:hypothetical protein
MRFALVVLLVSGCHDWADLSSGLDGGDAGQGGGGQAVGGGQGGGTADVGGGVAAGGGVATGGGTATGGGQSTGGGAATGGGTAMGGGTATGGGTASGGGTGGGGIDPTSCMSRGAFTCPAALFCDGFDEVAFKPAWSVDTSNGTITDADSCPYRGTRSAHSQLTALSSGVKGHAQITEVDSGTPSEVFIRVFARVDSADAMANHILTVMPPSPSTDALFLYYGSGNLAVGGTVATPTATHAFPLGQWVCVEWQLTTGNMMHVWLDGADVIDGDDNLAQLERVILGLDVEDHSNAITGTTDLWLDDLVVSTSRVGCN